MIQYFVLLSNFVSSGLLWWFVIQSSLSTASVSILTIAWATPNCALVLTDNIIFLILATRNLTRRLFQGHNEVVPQDAESMQPQRIAMITTKTPSEPLVPTLVRTLSSLVQQQYTSSPVDVWLADEAADSLTRLWCEANGVQIISRKGVDAYHNTKWPRRTRCKEGNLAHFYETVGYDRYDFVFQFDSDHAPEPDYLKKAMPYFLSDPNVSYLAFPSINDQCVDASWIGRARLVSDAHDNGTFAMCFKVPMLTGSHYAVRTSALRAIGGIGPELDEDMSTTMMFASRGHRGAYVMDAIAHGHGPACFAHAMRQEFQWAKSATTLFTRRAHIQVMFGGPDVSVRRVLGRMTVLVYWYLSQIMWVMWIAIAPIVACFVHTVSAPHTTAFLVCVGPSIVSALGYLECIRRTGGMRPQDIPRSWGIDVLVLRQYRALWITLGVFDTIIGSGALSNIRVTPKGGGDNEGTPCTMYLLPAYVVCGVHIACMTAASIVWPDRQVSPVIVLVGGLCTLGIVYVHIRDTHKLSFRCCRDSIAPLVLVVAYVVSWSRSWAGPDLWAQMFIYVPGWIERIMVIVVYAVSFTSLILTSTLACSSSSLPL